MQQLLPQARIDLQICLCTGFKLTVSNLPLYWHSNSTSSPPFSRAFALILQLTVELLLFAEAWIAFKADDAWVALCYWIFDCCCGSLLRIGPSGRFLFKNNARGCWRWGCFCLLKNGLLWMLLKLGFLFVMQAWTAVADPCCGSALRTDLFF